MGKSNNYDDYAADLAALLRSGAQKSHAYIEKPAMLGLLPNLKGKSVLCVGCGTGEECGELLERGAHVTGFDTSSASVKLARKAFPAAQLEVRDMHDLSNYDEAQFDFGYSSLVLHYSPHPGKALQQLYRVLTSGGIIQISVLHPIKWAAEFNRDSADADKKSFLMGYDTFQKPTHVYGNYLQPTRVTQRPRNYPEITYWNRPISEWLKIIREAGFELLDFTEPQPTAETKKLDPQYWETYSKIPQFMIFLAQKSVR